jgi:hypothetical protein
MADTKGADTMADSQYEIIYYGDTHVGMRRVGHELPFIVWTATRDHERDIKNMVAKWNYEDGKNAATN